MRFKGFVDEWESVTINNLSKIVTKQTGFDYTNTIKKALKTERTKDTLPYIQTKNFHDRRIDYNTDYYIPLDIADKFPRIKLDEECILLSIVGASVGNIGFFNHKEDSFLSGAICVVKTKKYTYLNDIYHYMQSPYGQVQIKITTKGAAQATITIDDIRNYIIKRSLNEMERNKIVSFLNLIDERIYTQNKIIEKYESLIKPLFETLNSNANIDITIKELGPYVSADLLSWNDMNDAGKPAIIYGQLFTDYKYIIEKVISKTERRIKTKTKDNDLLFPSSTTVDSLSLIAPSSIKIPGVIIGGDMFKIELDKDKFDSDYMSFLINCSLNKKIAKYAQGSTIIHLYYEDIKLFRMKICDIEKQKEISKQMKVLLEKIFVERSIIELLQKQKKYFLDNLFI